MANTSRVNGFNPSKYLNGSPWNGQVTRYYVTAGDATAIYIGDLVKIDGGSDGNGIRSVTQAAASQAVCGAVVACAVNPANLNIDGLYRAASTARYVFVADDPNVLFEVQANGTVPTADVGSNANIVVGSGSTVTGQSGMQLDYSTTGTTATLPLKIIELVQRPDNDISSTNAKFLVKLNNHQLQTGTGVVGV